MSTKKSGELLAFRYNTGLTENLRFLSPGVILNLESVYKFILLDTMHFRNTVTTALTLVTQSYSWQEYAS